MSADNQMEVVDKDKAACVKSLRHVLSVFIDLSKAVKLNWSTRKEFLGAIKTILRMDNVEEFESLADLFLKGIRDDDFRVRMFMAKAISVFFDLFEDEEGILRDINKNLPIAPTSKFQLFFFKLNFYCRGRRELKNGYYGNITSYIRRDSLC
jgi:hypothetical protein